MLVLPGLHLVAQLAGREFAGREHDLARSPVDRVAVYIYVRELVVRAERLKLRESAEQRAVVPEPDVVDNGAVLTQLLGCNRVDSRNLALAELVQPEGRASGGDVVQDVRGFFGQFAGLDLELLHEPRVDTAHEHQG